MKVKELQALLSRCDGEANVIVHRPFGTSKFISYPIDECWIEDGRFTLWIDSESLAGNCLKRSIKAKRNVRQ